MLPLYSAEWTPLYSATRGRPLSVLSTFHFCQPFPSHPGCVARSLILSLLTGWPDVSRCAQYAGWLPRVITLARSMSIGREAGLLSQPRAGLMGGYPQTSLADVASRNRVPVPPPERDPLATSSTRGFARHGLGVFFPAALHTTTALNF